MIALVAMACPLAAQDPVKPLPSPTSQELPPGVRWKVALPAPPAAACALLWRCNASERETKPQVAKPPRRLSFVRNADVGAERRRCAAAIGRRDYDFRFLLSDLC